jgi:hypothetical protein
MIPKFWKKSELLSIYVATAIALLLIGFAIWLVCSGCFCPRIARHNLVPEYPVNRSVCQFTPTGVCLLLNNNIVSDGFYLIVDDKINETESCLKEWYANKPDVLHRVYNWKSPARSCYTILLVDDWTTSCDGEWQVFGQAPQESCNAKGFTEDPNCPCKFRGLLQDSTILVPPDLKFLRVEIVMLLTGYRDVDFWATPDLIKCGGY